MLLLLLLLNTYTLTSNNKKIGLSLSSLQLNFLHSCVACLGKGGGGGGRSNCCCCSDDVVDNDGDSVNVSINCACFHSKTLHSEKYDNEEEGETFAANRRKKTKPSTVKKKKKVHFKQ